MGIGVKLISSLPQTLLCSTNLVPRLHLKMAPRSWVHFLMISVSVQPICLETMAAETGARSKKLRPTMLRQATSLAWLLPWTGILL